MSESLLERIVRIPSPSGEEAEVAAFLASSLAERGFRVERDAAGNVLGTRGSSGPHLMLVCHMDTVPGEIPVRWQDGVLWGRGTVDAKGPLAAAIEAVSGARRIDGRVTVVACIREETDGLGARSLAKREAPDAAIILEPGGWRGITVEYRGHARLEVEFRVPSRHLSRPEPTAADLLATFADGLRQALAGEPTPGIEGRYTCHLADIVSGEGGHTTRGIFDIRIPVGGSMSVVQSSIDSFSPRPGVHWTASVPPVRVDRKGRLCGLFAGAIRRLGGSPAYLRKSGTSDLNILAPAWNVPCAAYGPGDSALSHTDEERLSSTEFQRGVSVLQCVVERFGTALR